LLEIGSNSHKTGDILEKRLKKKTRFPTSYL